MLTMNRVLEQDRKYSVIYLDDIMVHLQTRWDSIKYVNNVLASIRKPRLRLNEKKSGVGVTETSFVSHGISVEGIDTEQRKIEAKCTWPTSRSAGELCSFRDLASYCR
jgi:hypothetical protein